MPMIKKVKVWKCCNCNMTLTRESQVRFEIQDIHERVAPGEPMPAGECRECGALVHEEIIEQPIKTYTFSVEGVVIRQGFNREAVREKLQADLEEVFSNFYLAFVCKE